ncbi:MAG TPA: TerC family protein [Pyrinomonadaceae bacterium]|nr:TerC family protein [Chloracidobacterium sp.]HRA41357.1 TerC family protein [Pyrinomonadaceae bacterium]MBK7803828.1 TerC family protein [Chloracidobacterium sp.]MBK9439500.1 TerC family protein [Chloracidobacterium sp.]MBK9768381.1 TerC family protein [Chloracidobacterium sp.]
MNLFPFAEYWWLYAAFLVFVLAMLAIDLGIFNRKEHVVSFKEAAAWSVVWVILAMTFAGGFYWYTLGKFGAVAAKASTLEFLTGYVLEYSLSIDNIFIFVLVFAYFGIPAKYKHRVLFYGILGALIFRAIFIAAGSALMQFHWVIYLFGGFLILTGIKMFFTSNEEIDPEKNLLIRTFKRFMPVTHSIDGKSFFLKLNGRWHATPLFIALLFLEATDVIFAVDSVPAIFAVTNEPFIVFSSNIFAIMGLRSMYFMLAGVIDKFYLLKFGLAVVLVFVGLKMVWLNDAFDGKFPISYSLAFIISVIAASIVFSLLFPRPVGVGETSQNPDFGEKVD